MVDTLILDLLDPEEARRPPMVMKECSDEFRADAVALYESTPGAIYKSIAADLGVNRAPLREWVLRDRERRGVTAEAAKPGAPSREAVPSADPDERVRQLEARVAQLEASERKLATQRDILRRAAKYFAGDCVLNTKENWL
ncbi:transposase [Streptomyces sp. MBT65]|uniref:transposase n=1 Tax=Streptomyces sp. MBT65 TaxID=1488395 RepID=UPI001909597D|nr:transposase [Streptomyces sp. MBT65]MBK3573464.1 transposase [Streptomyces sp. MBT65]